MKENIANEEALNIIKKQVFLLKNNDNKLWEYVYKVLKSLLISNNYKQFYVVLCDLKFNLNDDSLRHVRNYAAWYLLEKDIENDNNLITTINLKCVNLLLDFVVEESFTSMFEEKHNIEIKNKSRELWTHKAD